MRLTVLLAVAGLAPTIAGCAAPPAETVTGSDGGPPYHACRFEGLEPNPFAFLDCVDRVARAGCAGALADGGSCPDQVRRTAS